MKLCFTVDGAPVGWQRTGFRPAGGMQTRFFTPKAVKEYQDKIWLAARLAGFRGDPWTGPVAVRVVIYLADARRRDVDNYAKQVLDALNSKPARPARGKSPARPPVPRLFKDDSQVVDLHLLKRIDRAQPRLEVELEQVPLDDPKQVELALGGKRA